MNEQQPVRLNKFLALCGIGSRRKADELIAGGKIYVNGSRVTELGSRVVAGKDKVEYWGKEIKPFHILEYFAYYKPRSVMVTRIDPEGRETIYDALSKAGATVEHLNYVGRLDFGSEGLLLLTNDGELIHALTHPRFQIKKVYRVKVDRLLTADERKKMIDGIESNGQVLHAREIRDISEVTPERKQFWYELDLFEGKNRQIRRMFEALGILVGRLRRVQFGSVKLGEMQPGEIRPLTEKEIMSLKNTGYKIDNQ
ncbi:MAG TPA: pseudouridine synthase [Chitinispirillaceae bacterium]|nr:pseudouridine synthase [Chitinispirillaceae bacterium]